MAEIGVTLLKGDVIGVETDYRDALPVNMYAVKKDILGAQGYMLNYPGLVQIVEGRGADRGGVYNERQSTHFRISGKYFVRVNNNTTTTLGSVPGTEQVAMPYSFQSQLVVAGGNAYRYDGTTFSQIIDSDLGNPIDCVWIDGYYFFTDGEYIYHTDIDDETSIDPLKFATAEFMPDASLGLAKTQHNQVVVFGRYSIEYFDNTANENFAFTRQKTRSQKIGIVATHAKCEIKDIFFICGGRKEEALGFHAVTLGQSNRISTREIDKILEQYDEPDLVDMRMEVRQEKGTVFVIAHLPNETLLYNLEMQSWSILKSGTEDGQYPAINGVFDAQRGYYVFGDKINSRIGKLDNTVATIYDEYAEWILYTPFLKLERSSLDEIEIDSIPGHTTTPDATVFLSATFDGNFYGKETTMQYGAPNDYHQRFIARRLGYVREYVSLKFRGVSASRMAFALFKLTYS